MRMFATLDPTLRSITLPSRRQALLSDTVGFIRNLPHTLISAFRATLEEVQRAALILHVADASSPTAAEQMQQVEAVLRELESERTPRLLVVNKIDGVKVAPGRRLHVGEPASGTRATRGRHHKAADATVDETRGNAHEAESAKGSKAKSANAESGKKSGTSAVKKRHARSRKSASSAEKSGASGATEAHAKKPVAKRKSPTRKEK